MNTECLNINSQGYPTHTGTGLPCLTLWLKCPWNQNGEKPESFLFPSVNDMDTNTIVYSGGRNFIRSWKTKIYWFISRQNHDRVINFYLKQYMSRLLLYWSFLLAANMVYQCTYGYVLSHTIHFSNSIQFERRKKVVIGFEEGGICMRCCSYETGNSPACFTNSGLFNGGVFCYLRLTEYAILIFIHRQGFSHRKNK